MSLALDRYGMGGRASGGYPALAFEHVGNAYRFQGRVLSGSSDTGHPGRSASNVALTATPSFRRSIANLLTICGDIGLRLDRSSCYRH